MPATLDYPTLLLLGLIAGATIFLGLPIGRLPTVNPAIRSGLSMLAAGILLFLLVEILGKANEQTVDALRDGPLLGGVMILALLGGLLVGLVGLVGIEQRLIGGVLRKRYRWRSQAGTGSRTKRAVLVVALGRPCHQAKMRPRLIPAAVAIPCKRSFASPR